MPKCNQYKYGDASSVTYIVFQIRGGKTLEKKTYCVKAGGLAEAQIDATRVWFALIHLMNLC